MMPKVRELVDGIANGTITPANARDAVRQCGGESVVILEVVRALMDSSAGASVTMDIIDGNLIGTKDGVSLATPAFPYP